MVEIDNTLVSMEIFEKKFACDLTACKGQCCVDGDSGAPIEKHEIAIIEQIYEKIIPFMRGEGIKAIKEQGVYVVDYDNEIVTPLINHQECAYTVFEEGIVKCAFEKAYNEGIINFQKPISCHLYPIRILKLSKHDALNYDRWDICKSALKCGVAANLPVYKFLKYPLIRKYGKEWYKELELVAIELEKAKR